MPRKKLLESFYRMPVLDLGTVLVFILTLFPGAQVITAQSLTPKLASDSIATYSVSGQAEILLAEKKYEELRLHCDTQLVLLTQQEIKDSLTIASLYYHKFVVQHHNQDYRGSIKSTKAGLAYCPRTKDGDETRGVLWYKQAHGEAAIGLKKRSVQSMFESINTWTNMAAPNLDYLVGAYSFLSSNRSYHGNLEDAKRYLRLAEKVYFKNKKVLDQMRTDLDGSYDRYEVILKYRKIYLLTQWGKSKKDSLDLLQTLQELTHLHSLPAFHKAERIYYSTALNHVGAWYLKNKADSLITQRTIDSALKYINKSIDLITNRGYPGDYSTFYFNKCKALTHTNNLVKAEEIIDNLLEKISDEDGRKPFFLAQKGLIEAKGQQKQKALATFYRAIQKVHTGDKVLKEDWSNFKPSEVYGETRLILRIIEELNTYYGEDPEIQATIAKLYYLAFLQFENSYPNTSFNAGNNEKIRQIVQNILIHKQSGFELNEIPIPSLLSRTETLLNQLVWKRFYQNSQTSALPELDAMNRNHLTLRKQLALAKQENNLVAIDSLQQLIQTHMQNTQKHYANLDLLSSKAFQVEDLQTKLAPDEVVLKYLLLDQQLALFVISKNELHWEFRPWTEKEIELTQSFIEEVKTRQYRTITAQKLHQLLLPELPVKIKQLIINPDGLLAQLPFEVLQKEGNFLLNSFTINYTSNLGLIHPFLESQGKQKKQNILAIYVPQYTSASGTTATKEEPLSLFGAQAEAKAISQLFSSKVYAGDGTTKQQFFETAPQAGLLHLAMHAVVNKEDPSLSHLLFGTGQRADERLYLEELYALQIQADLAVLSACETGLGKENAGGYMESIQRAFTFSGVPTTVASLWKVPDQATVQIMESFYGYLRAGYDKAEALQKAKIAYLKNTTLPQLREPYYWAGFVIYGEDGPVNIRPWYRRAYIPIIGLGLFLLALMTFFIRRREKIV